MASVFRFLVPALRQLSAFTLATQHDIRFSRQKAVLFCSRLRSDDCGRGGNVNALSDSAVQNLHEKEGFRKQSKNGKKEQWWRYKTVKLHRRKLTAEEQARDELLNEQMSELTDQDRFGKLKRSDKIGRLNELDSNVTVGSASGFDSVEELSLPKGKSSDSAAMFGYNKQSPVSNKSVTSTPRPILGGRAEQRDSAVKLRKSKQWTENFGTLKNVNEDDNNWTDYEKEPVKLDNDEMDYYSSDDEGKPPLRRLSSHGKHSPQWYGRQMKQFANEGKIKEAIDVLDVWMLRNDRIRPDYFVFSVLISILGRAGYTKKAFQVFNQMKKMGIQPKDNTYTALFNACSNSPWPEDGLQRAANLHSLMLEKGVRPNIITYRSMIKAYGVCGDIQAAFRVLDEASVQCQSDHKSFNFLLMACCSDKEAGFRHAIGVWRLMKQHHIQPNIYHYNLLLRAIRDCGIGDLNMAVKVIYGADIPAEQFVNNVTRPLNLGSGHLNDNQSLDNNISEDVREKSDKPQTERMLMVTDDMETDGEMSALVDLSYVTDLPSILSSPLDPAHAVGVDLSVLKSAEGRLAISGGMMGILSSMAADDVKPDIKTLSQFINSIPPNLQAEKELICQLEEHGIRPDVDFFNMVIRKRNLRRDYDSARDLLTVIGQHKLLPNMMTFGCLAMGCRKKADGLQLLQDMEISGLTPNREIFTILVYNSGSDFHYKLNLLQEMERGDLEPKPKLLMYVEQKIQQAKEMIVKQEAGQAVPDYYTSDYFMEGYKRFMQFYGHWLKRTPVAKSEHPWAKFRHPKEPMKGQDDHAEVDEDKTTFVRNR